MNIEKMLEQATDNEWRCFAHYTNKWEIIAQITSKMPGVYMLSLSDQNLCGEKITPNDVIYVGMTLAKYGISGRLKAFINSANGNNGHSGGKTFNEKYNICKQLSCSNKCRLFVSYCEFDIDVDKNKRTAPDLKVMGHIVCLEKYLIAWVKYETQNEPAINKL